MGFIIRKLPYKTRTWKLQFHNRIGGVSKYKDFKETELLSLGFHKTMTVEQAKLKCSSLNKLEHIKRTQTKKINIQERMEVETLQLDSLLPDFFVQEFEKLYINSEDKKKLVVWKTCKKVISTLNIDIYDWNFNKLQFYRLFQKNKYSFSYCEKIITNLNRWGRFLSYKKNQPFANLELPKAQDKEKIIEANEEFKPSKVSETITMDELNVMNLPLKHYNWMYLSMWLGLRPKEVDRLKLPSGKQTWILKDNILWIYQSKLTGISKEKRLKPIPLKYKEQLEVLPIILSKEFSRPLVKSLKNKLNKNVNLYAGRKSFTNLMLFRGERIESISQWLGHRNIKITWQTYLNPKQVLGME